VQHVANILRRDGRKERIHCGLARAGRCGCRILFFAVLLLPLPLLLLLIRGILVVPVLFFV